MNNKLNLDKWERADNYAGQEFYEYYRGPVQQRDSGILEQSNFQCALERLGGEIDGQVEVIRSGHWAVGWVEQILVHESATDKLEILSKIKEELEEYPVLDEGDYCDRQSEYFHEYAEQSKQQIAAVLVRLFGLGEELEDDEQMLALGCELQVEYQHYAGEDASLYSNEFHVDKIDERDLKAYETVLNDIKYHAMESEYKDAYELICVCFGIELDERKAG